MILRSLLFVKVLHILPDLQLDEPVYNKAEPDTFIWDGRSAVSMDQRHLVNCFLAEERPAN